MSRARSHHRGTVSQRLTRVEMRVQAADAAIIDRGLLVDLQGDADQVAGQMGIELLVKHLDQRIASRLFDRFATPASHAQIEVQELIVTTWRRLVIAQRPWKAE